MHPQSTKTKLCIDVSTGTEVLIGRLSTKVRIKWQYKENVAAGLIRASLYQFAMQKRGHMTLQTWKEGKY